MAQKRTYAASYAELEVIGRGNFGSATLVRANDDNNIYIAKKVLLGGLSQKEADGALLEVNLLRELKHPHIVEYRDSYVENNVLIIIMEYCEEGDLSHFIKKKEQKQEALDEKLVLNWFLQILLALEFVHRKKILHRDIKSSNIFLRSNGTVKLGDFGISRVLENTNEAAMTVVGTPYYMSPEVCENKPYTFKSDVWALGCVVYEMCTLKHAFSASNLLGLVYKIVREQNEPIPTNYSRELSILVQKLLSKNVQERPSIRDLFMESLVQRTIEEFIRTDGQFTTMLKIPIKKTPLHNEMKKNQPNAKSIEDQHGTNSTMMSVVSNSTTARTTETETPQQRMARRKEEARKLEEEKMKAAARESLMARNQDKDRKNKELQGNMPVPGSNLNNSRSMANMQGSKAQFNVNVNQSNYSNSPVRVSNQYDNNQIAYQQQTRQSNMGYDYDEGQKTLPTMNSLSNASAFGGNDYGGTMQRGFMEQTNQSLAYSQSQGTLAQKLQSTMQNTYQHNQFANNNYNQNQGYGTRGGYGIKDNTGMSAYSIKTEFELHTGTNYGGTALYRPQDERPLPALVNKNSNSKQIAEDDEELYEDDFDGEYAEDFEEYWSDGEDDANRLTVKPAQKDLSDVINLYKEKLNINNYDKNSYQDDEQPEQLAKSQKIVASNAALAKRQEQIDILRTRAKKELGVKVFEEAYEYLKRQRQLNVPDKKIQEDLSSIVGKKNLTHCFTIDQIIFLELESM